MIRWLKKFKQNKDNTTDKYKLYLRRDDTATTQDRRSLEVIVEETIDWDTVLNKQITNIYNEDEIVEQFIYEGALLRYKEHLLRVVQQHIELKIIVCDIARLEILEEEKEQQQPPTGNVYQDFKMDLDEEEKEEEIIQQVEPFDWNNTELSKEKFNV